MAYFLLFPFPKNLCLKKEIFPLVTLHGGTLMVIDNKKTENEIKSNNRKSDNLKI